MPSSIIIWFAAVDFATCISTHQSPNANMNMPVRAIRGFVSTWLSACSPEADPFLQIYTNTFPSVASPPECGMHTMDGALVKVLGQGQAKVKGGNGRAAATLMCKNILNPCHPHPAPATMIRGYFSRTETRSRMPQMPAEKVAGVLHANSLAHWACCR